MGPAEREWDAKGLFNELEGACLSGFFCSATGLVGEATPIQCGRCGWEGKSSRQGPPQCIPGSSLPSQPLWCIFEWLELIPGA
jgi:hypothetical protein